VASYAITDSHGGSVAQTNTISMSGPAADPSISSNHAPTVAAALIATAAKGAQSFLSNLLSGASDVDAGNHLSVTDLLFSVNGGASGHSAPAGIQLVNNQLLVDPNHAAFSALSAGQSETILASYNISDGHGGAVAQTDTITINGASVVPVVPPSPSLIAVAAALHSTSSTGSQGFWSDLLAGASDVNPSAHLSVANLTFSVDGAAASAAIPAGIQYANNAVMIDPNHATFAGLGAGQTETIVAHYNIIDGLGGSVAQTDTIIMNGSANQAGNSGHANIPTPGNHDPVLAAPVAATAGFHTSAFWSNLLSGATDADAGNQLHVSNVLFSVNGGSSSASAPIGIQLANDQLLVDPNSTAFNHLGVGQSDTIVASYNVTDGHGGSVAQTDTITINGPAATVVNGAITGTVNHDLLTGTSANDTIIAGLGADTLTGSAGADVFKFLSLLNSPTSASTPTTTITDFSTAEGDRIDLSAILNGSSTVNSSIHISQSGASSTSMSITVGGVEYFIANLPGQEVSAPDALANHASGTTLTTALHGADWTNVVDVTSAQGAPSTVTAAGSATIAQNATNPTGDWTAVVQSGAATVDTAHSQIAFTTAPAANDVSIHTADTVVHDLNNVTAVAWHA
jgi:hypothetical protein